MKKKGIDISLDTKELAALINTLSFARAVFQQSVERVTEEGDMESARQLQDRADTCMIFIDILIKNMNIGDPPSTTFH